MRETKDQKITRLERQKKELEDLVKQLKKTNKGSDKDYKEEIKNLKSTIRDLKSNHKLEIEQLVSEIEILKEELKEVKYKNDCLKLGQILKEDEEKNRGKSKELTTRSFKECKREIEQDILDENQRRLREFEFGYDTDRYDKPYYSLKDLLTNVNPMTGEWLSDFQRQMLLEFVRNKDVYKRYLKEVSSMTSKSDEYKIYDKCRELYQTLYKDYRF